MKQSTIFTGFLWKLFERIGTQLITFVISLVLARIIEPQAYGMIAILLAFITFADVFITSGFGSGLIQKKDADDLDFNSVFYFNLLFSMLLYLIVFIFSPFIEKLYGSDFQGLSLALRVFAIRLPICAINNIQEAYVSRKMQFRSLFVSNLIGAVCSGVVGIVMALNGFGYWALIAQYLLNAIIYTVVLWMVVKWRPSLSFSWERLSGLLKYGWKLLVASLIGAFYEKIRTVLIGKLYSSDDLAYYSKGGQYPGLIIDNVCVAIISVLFPALSKVQNDKIKIKALSRMSMGMTCFAVFPIMAGLLVTAEAVVRITLTEKWIMAVPFLQLFCVIYVVKPITQAMSQIIKSTGRTDISLQLEIFKRIIGIAFLLVFLRRGVIAIAITYAATSFIGAIIDMYVAGKLVDYRMREQVKDIFPTLISTIVMLILTMIVGMIKWHYLIVLLLQVFIGVISYLLMSLLLKNESLKLIVDFIFKNGKRKNSINCFKENHE